METFKKRLKPIAIFLTALLLLQSCVLYHKTPTNLEQASQQPLKTKVTTADNKTYKFNYVTYDNGVFYGIKERKGKLVRTSLYNENVTAAYVMNDDTSVFATIGVIVAIPALVFLLYWAAMTSY